jgi:hypothetical protein
LRREGDKTINEAHTTSREGVVFAQKAMDALESAGLTVVNKQRLKMLERIARIVSNIEWEVLDCGVAFGQLDSLLDYAGLDEALDELEAMG